MSYSGDNTQIRKEDKYIPLPSVKEEDGWLSFLKRDAQCAEELALLDDKEEAI